MEPLAELNPLSILDHHRSDVMNSLSEELLVVESDDALREAIASVLRDAGYQVSTDFHLGMKQFSTTGLT